MNGMFPGKLTYTWSESDVSKLTGQGPLIEVNEGDTVIVHVNNQLSMGQAIRELPVLLFSYCPTAKVT